MEVLDAGEQTCYFPTVSTLAEPEKVRSCEGKLRKKLGMQGEEAPARRLNPHFSKVEIKALLKRRKQSIVHLQDFVDQRREGRIIDSFG